MTDLVEKSPSKSDTSDSNHDKVPREDNDDDVKESSDEQDVLPSSDEDESDSADSLPSGGIDLARGEGNIETSSSEDDSTDDEESSQGIITPFLSL